ncbi:DUF3310 domain-containing protein [Streptomyces sp. NPDC002644]
MKSFKVGDRVVVIDSRSDFHGDHGRVVSLSEGGWPRVKLDMEAQVILFFHEELEYEKTYEVLSAAPEVASEGADPVNHPSHYVRNGFEVIEIIEAFELNFRLANVTKYVLRADSKHDDGGVQDLKKALFYLSREIEKREAKSAQTS